MKCTGKCDNEYRSQTTIHTNSPNIVYTKTRNINHQGQLNIPNDVDSTNSHYNISHKDHDSKFPIIDHQKEDHKDTVVLEPFVHQVGGHNVFLTYNSNLLCKVFNADEYLFYKYMSSSLKNFIPKFNGLANVHRCVDDNGDLSYVGSCINEGDIDPKLISRREIRNEQDRWDANCIKRSESFERVINQKRCHPWYIEARKRFDIKWEKYNYSEKIFMMLENVTTNYDRPCVLDVKIGFRAHGDHTDPQKIERKILRCQTTTTSSCGIRLCGLQTYHVKTDSYTFLNKYNGRSLNIEQLQQKLSDYFYDGEDYRYQLIKPFVGRLFSLMNTLKQLPSLRLFATSVLLIYEGNMSYEQLRQLSSDEIEKYLDLRLIDFAQSSFVRPTNLNDVTSTNTEYDNNRTHDVQHIGPDESFVLGLSNLANIFEDIFSRFSEQ